MFSAVAVVMVAGKAVSPLVVETAPTSPANSDVGCACVAACMPLKAASTLRFEPVVCENSGPPWPGNRPSTQRDEP